MERIMAELRLRRAMHHCVLPAAYHTYVKEDEVLMWREKVVAGRIGVWYGPFLVHSFDSEKNIVIIQNKNEKLKEFKMAQVKLFLPPAGISHTFFSDLGSAMKEFESETPPEPKSFSSIEVGLVTTLEHDDRRATSPEIMKARQKEFYDLMSRGVFEVVKRSDIPKVTTSITSKFVFAIKSPMNAPEENKSRYPTGGHRDKMKKLIVHTTQTLAPSSIRLLSTVAECLGLELWISDALQAFLQSANTLDRPIYIIDPAPDFDLPPDKFLMIVRPIYVLCELGDMWNETLDEHHTKDLGMFISRLDPELYFNMYENQLVCMSGTYVHDILRAVTKEFKQLAAKTHETFDMKDEKTIPTEFKGFQLDRDTYGALIITQTRYLRKLESLPSDASFLHFRSMRMHLAWLSNTRPDCMFAISQLAQVTEDMFEKNPEAIIKNMNKATSYTVKHAFGIKINKLYLYSLRVLGFSDASFANNYDFTSQVGHFIFLAEKNDNGSPSTSRVRRNFV